MKHVRGSWEPGYEPVAQAFATALNQAPTGGGALAINLAGKLVVDVWGGWARPRARIPWRRDTVSVGFSIAKALLATCALKAAQDGDLDLDAPCSTYWPEFSNHGKDGVTARIVLAHRAGLPALDRNFTLDEALDGGPVVVALEQQTPLWEPGTAHGYHAFTYGWLVSEILRRSTGRPLGDHLSALTAHPGNDTWIGLPDRAAGRLAEAAWDADHSSLIFPPDTPGTRWQQRAITRSVTLGGAFFPALVGPGSGLNDPHILRAGVPGVGVVTTARSLATVSARTVAPINGETAVLDPTSVATASLCLSEGTTAFDTPGAGRWASGHMLNSRLAPMLTHASFGHDGAGGQLSFADPTLGLGFAFLTNVLRNTGDDRGRRIVEALRQCLTD